MLTTPISGNKLWVNFGENPWFDPNMQLVIFTLENPNFRRFLVMDFYFSYLIDYSRGYISNDERNRLGSIVLSGGKDINTIEEMEEYISKDYLEIVNKKIESYKREENGKIVYELPAGVISEHREILSLMVLKNLPIVAVINQKADHNAKLEGLAFNLRPGAQTMNEFFKKNSNIQQELSFLSMADTIVDLAAKKVHKFIGASRYVDTRVVCKDRFFFTFLSPEII